MKKDNDCRRRGGRWTAVLVAAAIVFCLIAPTRAVAGDLPVSLFPPDSWIETGDLCTLQVRVNDVVDSVSCMEIFIRFDPALLEVETAREGRLYQESPFTTFFDWDLVAPDTVSAIDCVLGYRTCVITPGELVMFVFRGIADGKAAVKVTTARLWDVDRAPLITEIAGGANIQIGNVTGENPEVPARGFLANHPNPFNPSTSILLFIPWDGMGSGGTLKTRLSIFDSRGALVRLLFDGQAEAGINRFAWDGRNDSGADVASGIYYATARTGTEVYERKLVIVR